MTLFLDHRGNLPLELGVTLRQFSHLGLSFIDLNTSNKPDVYWVGWGNESHGIELKQPGEFLGGLDSLEEQLQREYPTVDHLSLLVVGNVIASESGCRIVHPEARKPTGVKGGEPFKTNYQGLRSKFRSFRRWGIDVVEVPDKHSAALEIVSHYDWTMVAPESHKTFTRVLPVKPLMPPEASPFVKSLICLHDSETGRTWVGEEVAVALETAGFTSLAQLGAAGVELIAPVMLRSGKRSVGKLTAEKIRRAING